MAQTSCPGCGFPLNGYETFCPECNHQFSRQQQIQNAFYDEEGDNEAEEILRKALNSIKNLIIFFSIIVGVVCVLAPIAGGAGPMAIGGVIVGIIVILLGIAVARLIWSIGMIFINISTNVRSIKKIVISK